MFGKGLCRHRHVFIWNDEDHHTDAIDADYKQFLGKKRTFHFEKMMEQSIVRQSDIQLAEYSSEHGGEQQWTLVKSHEVMREERRERSWSNACL